MPDNKNSGIVPRDTEINVEISNNKEHEISQPDTEQIPSSSISEDGNLKINVEEDSASEPNTEETILSDESLVHQQDKEETPVPGPSSGVINSERSDMFKRLKRLSDAPQVIIDKLQSPSQPDEHSLLKTLDACLYHLQKNVRDLMKSKDSSFVPELDASFSVISAENPRHPVPPVDNIVSIIPMGSLPLRLEISECRTSLNEHNLPPNNLFSLTQFYAIKKHHESIIEGFRLAFQRLQPPAFPVWHIECQRVLISLFLHLLKDFEEFIEFLLGKEEVSTSDQLSNKDEAERLAFVKGYFACFEKQKALKDKIDRLRKRINEIRPHTKEISNEERCFEYRYSVTPLREFIQVIKSNTDLYKNEVSEDWLKFIKNLNGDTIALIFSCRDTTRAIVDYLYQLKLSIFNSPRLDEFLDSLLKASVSFLELREEYNNLMCIGLINENFHLHVKIKIAFQLKELLMSILRENSKFWDTPSVLN